MHMLVHPLRESVMPGLTESDSVTAKTIRVVLLALGVTAESQQAKKVPRIEYLSNIDPAAESDRIEAIQLALRNLGYIEGQNIATEYRYAKGKRDRLPELAAELVRLKLDIIVAVGGDPLFGLGVKSLVDKFSE